MICERNDIRNFSEIFYKTLLKAAKIDCTRQRVAVAEVRCIHKKCFYHERLNYI